MTFRENETEQFPFESCERTVWYAIITFEGGFKKHSFTSSKSGKRDFMNRAEILSENGVSHILMGIWQGKWKTDIFILDRKVMMEKIKSVV